MKSKFNLILEYIKNSVNNITLKNIITILKLTIVDDGKMQKTNIIK